MKQLLMTALLAGLALQAHAGVFISEYIEGSSYNKALEIYNGSGAAIDLADYRFGLASNGGASPTSYTFTGSLAAGEVFVVAHASAGAAILAVADQTSSGFANWNGDDFVGLYQMIAGNPVLIDAIGVLGTDPGTSWAVAGASDGALNHTLTRKPTITQGTTDWAASAGTTPANSQWSVLAQDTFSGLGSHSVDTGYPVVANLAHLPISPTDSQPVTVSAAVSDDGALSSVLLSYTVDGGAAQTQAMSPGTPPAYAGLIPAQAAGAAVVYHVEATDDQAHTTVSGNGAYTVAATQPPVLANLLHAPQTPSSTQSVTVSVQATDDGVVTSVLLSYSVGGGSAVTQPMTAAASPAWTGTIPAQADGSSVLWHAEAIDDQGLLTISATDSYVVDDLPAPVPVTAPVFSESSLALGQVSTMGSGLAMAHLLNTGVSPVLVERIEALGGFTVSPSSTLLAPGQSLAVQVQIQPPHNLHYAGWVVASGDWGATAIPLTADGDYPDTAWDATFNLSGTALKNELTNLVSVQTPLSYDAARQAIFGSLDNVGGWVECVYTGLLVQTSGIPDPTIMNTEHTWPQSYGAEGDARTDLHHLFPSDAWVNSSRGNLPFGEVVVSSNGYPLGGSDRGANAAGVTVFEPRDTHKGDAARAVLYFALRYGNRFGFLDMAAQEGVLRAWHQQDLVTAWESGRNDGIDALQHNRNPFIDQPGLLLRLASLSGSADFPAAPAALACYPDTLELACPNGPLTAQLWLANTGGTTLTISGVGSDEPGCLSLGNPPASLAPGAAALVPVTLSGACDGQAQLTVATSAGTLYLPLFWSWAVAAPAPPVVMITTVMGGHLLSWPTVAGASSYRVESATIPSGPWSALATTTDPQYLLAGEAWPAVSLFRVVSVGP